MSIDVNKFKALFLTILQEYQQQNRRDLSIDYSGDDVDKFSVERDNLLQFKLQGRDAFYIKKVKEALLRIEEGEFGICSDCGEPIEERRLNARPVATKCLHCKEEQERSEGHVLYHKRSHTHGKSLVSDVKQVPAANEDVFKEKVLKFNQRKIELGASAI